MSDENRKEREARFAGAQDSDSRGGLASRARNRTVLLTPETIGQVRATMEDDEGATDAVNELLPPMSWEPAAPKFGGEDDGYASVGRALEEVKPQIEQPPRRGTSKFSSPAAARSPSIPPALAQTTVMTSPMGAPKRPKEPTASNRRPAVPSEVAAEMHAVPQRAPARSKIVGFLVSFDSDEHGEVFDIRAGRWLVTSRPTDHGDFILIDDASISPLHAIIRATAEGKVQILDQLSEFGTGVLRSGAQEEEEVAGSMAAVSHGDIVRFGKRRFVVVQVPKPAGSEEVV